MAEEKQVATKSTTEVSLGDISVDSILKSAGRGLENITNDDITIPRLAIVQSGSPQRKKKDEKYIEGAEEGNMFNTVTNQLYDSSITIYLVDIEKHMLNGYQEKRVED
jgi:hypothetical protein